MADKNFKLFGGTIAWNQHRRMKNKLEKLLEQNLAAARAHEENGLPPGHKYYRGIFERSLTAVEEYRVRWEVPIDEMYEDYPTLVVLQGLAGNGDHSESVDSGFPIGRIVLVAVVLVVLSPALLGLWNGIYHAVVKKIGG